MPIPDTYVDGAPIEIDILAPQGPGGRTAYEVYRDTITDNPVLTEEQWLASLVGPPGATSWNDLQDKPTTFPPTIGSGSGDAVAGNDPRLTDARTPTAHKSTHATGGSDALTPADIGAASASEVGLLAIDVGNLIAKDAAANNYGTVVTLTGSRTLLSGDIGNTVYLSDFDLFLPSLAEWLTYGDSVAVKGTGTVVNNGTPYPLGGSATLVLRYYATGWEAFSVSAAGVTSYNDLTDLPTLGSAAALETSEGGNSASDSGKVVIFDFAGNLSAESFKANSAFSGRYLALSATGDFSTLFETIETDDRIISFPDASGEVVLSDGSIVAPVGGIRFTDTLFGGSITILQPGTITGSYYQYFPNKGGTIALTSDLTGLTEYATAAQGALADTALQPTVVTKTTPVDADTFEIQDSAASGARKLLSFANLKTWLQSWIDAITTIAGAKTFSGAASFTSTTRPTAANVTGTPAPESLITRTDGDARYGYAVTKFLTTDSAVRNGTTNPTDDSVLTGWTLKANTTYQILFGIYQQAGAGGFKSRFSIPSKSVAVNAYAGVYVNQGGASAAATYDATSISVAAYSGAGNSTQGGVLTFRTGSSGGAFAFQWACNTTTPGDTKISAGSYVTLIEMPA